MGDFVERAEMQTTVRELKAELRELIADLKGDLRSARAEHEREMIAALAPLTAAVEKQNGRVARLERLAAWGTGAVAVALWIVERVTR